VHVIKSLTGESRTLSLWMRPAQTGQLVFEVKNIKLSTEERALCVPATYLFAFFLLAAPSLQVASSGKGVTMNGSDDEEELSAAPSDSNFPNFDFNVGGNNTKHCRN
jgi:hypothetical protein